MGYFPNGESGRHYQFRYCDRCVHWPENPDDGGCNVWLLHLIDADQAALDVLIPRTENNLGNKQCSMFIERK